MLLPEKACEEDTSEKRRVKPRIQQAEYAHPGQVAGGPKKADKRKLPNPEEKKATVVSDLDEFFGEAKSKEAPPQSKDEVAENDDEYEYEEIDDDATEGTGQPSQPAA